jgi:diguanylate cyclase (GGDEF)-like protein
MEIKLYIKMIQRSWWLVALTALSAVLVALVSAYSTTPIYSSSARYLISPNPNFFGGDINYNLIYSMDTLDKRTIITTYAEVLNSPKIYSETLNSLNLQESKLTEYSHAAVVLPETNIIDFTVLGPDPNLVVTLVENVGQRAVAYVSAVYPIYDMAQLDPATLPTAPIYPQPIRDAGVALAVGLALGIGLALTRELLRAPISNFIQNRKVDEMSQALNRTAFNEYLKDISVASTKDFCLCILHIEGMREYLNVLPQSTLQNIFRHITQVLKNQLRGNDLVARWDDLEFSVLLYDTSGQAALNTMERVKTALSIPIRIDVSGEDLELKPVIGIAEYRVGDTSSSLTTNTYWALDVAKKQTGIYLLKATQSI